MRSQDTQEIRKCCHARKIRYCCFDPVRIDGKSGFPCIGFVLHVIYTVRWINKVYAIHEPSSFAVGDLNR